MVVILVVSVGVVDCQVGTGLGMLGVEWVGQQEKSGKKGEGTTGEESEIIVIGTMLMDGLKLSRELRTAEA